MVWRLCQSDNLSSERTEARNKPVQGWRGLFGGENGEGCEDRCPRREKVIVWERRWRDSRRKREVDEDHSSRGLWRGRERRNNRCNTRPGQNQQNTMRCNDVIGKKVPLNCGLI